MDEIFAGKLGYESVQLKSIRCGSVIVDLALKFSSTVRENEVLSILRDAVKNGKFGDLRVTAITGTRDTAITTTMATTPTSSSEIQACGDCACSCTVLGVVIGLLVVIIIALVVYILWLSKKGTETRDRVNRAASNEERGKMHVGLYVTESTSSQYKVLHEQPFT
ncbi:uncharacterized protein LOC110041527 [Orbicella faveolata]|uniref:uncharacterized protein LOC110041527 n=1 Tax=Orbicella faveolata TaxID=48498 RepID=UPI0009E1C2DC|nr:uncharacterized protein LOC110041527 [Orbicella faveolata]